MTSLSDQLKRLALPQTQAILKEKHRVSLLFEGSDVNSYDTQTIYSIGCNGLEELVCIDETFSVYRESLFAESSIRLERSVLDASANDKLNIDIKRFLVHTSAFYPLKAAQKAIEWLLFRFHIHEYNIDDVMRCILPHHDGNSFVRFLRILRIPENNHRWFWLQATKKSGLHLVLQTMVTHAVADPTFLSFLADTADFIVTNFDIGQHSSMQIHFALFAKLCVAVMSNERNVGEHLIAHVAPKLTIGLRSNSPTYSAASNIVLAQLLVSVKLNSRVCKSFLKTLIRVMQPENVTDIITMIILLFQTQDLKFSTKSAMKLVKKNQFFDWVEILKGLNNDERIDCVRFVDSFIENLFVLACFVDGGDELEPDSDVSRARDILVGIVHALHLLPESADLTLRLCFGCVVDESKSNIQLSSQLTSLASDLCSRFPAVFDAVLEDASTAVPEESMQQKQLQQFVNALKGVGVHQSLGASGSLYLSLNHANARVRCIALSRLLESAEFSRDTTESELDSVTSVIVDRFQDEEASVVELLLRNFQKIADVCDQDRVIAAALLLLRAKPRRKSWKHVRTTALIELSRWASGNQLITWDQDSAIQDSPQRSTVVRELLLSLSLKKHGDRRQVVAVLGEHEFWEKIGISKFLKDFAKNFAGTKMTDEKFIDERLTKLNFDLFRAIAYWLLDGGEYAIKNKLYVLSSSKPTDSYSRSMSLSIIHQALLIAGQNAERGRVQLLMMFLHQELLKLSDEIFENKIPLFFVYNSTVSWTPDAADLQGEALVADALAAFEDNATSISCGFLASLLRTVVTTLTFSINNEESDHWFDKFQCKNLGKSLLFLLRLIFSGLSHKNDSVRFVFKHLFGQLKKELFVRATDLSQLVCYTLYVGEPFSDLLAPLVKILDVKLKSISKSDIVPILGENSDVLPTLLICLASTDALVRTLAAQCVSTLQSRVSTFGSIGCYVSLLNEFNDAQVEIIVDPDQVPKHVEKFYTRREVEVDTPPVAKRIRRPRNSTPGTNDSQKQSGSLKAILALIDWLLSKEIPYELSNKMLEILISVHGDAILRKCIPRLKYVLGINEKVIPMEQSMVFVKKLIQKFNKRSVSCLNDSDTIFDDFLNLLAVIVNSKVTSCAMSMVTSDLFRTLNEQRQNLLVEKLLDLYTNPDSTADISSEIEATFSMLPFSGKQMTVLLQRGETVLHRERTTSRPTKRIKKDAPNEPTSGEGLAKCLRQLDFIVGCLATSSDVMLTEQLITPIFKLIAGYLEISMEVHSGRNYSIVLCLQLLQKCFDTCTNVSKSVIVEIDLLVRCIRECDSTNVHRSSLQLLVIAAHHDPTQVLQHVMAIFTFMGDSLVRQDDSYTFSVIENVLNAIVPALTSVTSAKARGRSDLQLSKSVVEVFRPFVDARPHIPPHRRQTLYKVLVCSASLNSSEKFNNYLWIFLGLVMDQLVIVEEVASKAPSISSSMSDVAFEPREEIFDFWLNFCSQFSCAEQLFACVKLLQYAAELPNSKEGEIDVNMLTVFDCSLRTEKQLQQFKILTSHMTSRLLGAGDFISQLALLSDSALENVGSFFEQILVCALEQSRHCKQQIDELVNVESQSVECKAMSKYFDRALVVHESLISRINFLLPVDMSLKLVSGLLTNEHTQLKCYALNILDSKLLQNPTPFTEKNIPSLNSVADTLVEWMADISTCRPSSPADTRHLAQQSLLTLKLLVRVSGPANPQSYANALISVTSLIGQWKKIDSLIVCNAVLLLGELVTLLKSLSLPLTSLFFEAIIELLGQSELLEKNETVAISLVSALQKIVEGLGDFMSPYVKPLILNLSSISVDSLKSRLVKSQFELKYQKLQLKIASLPSRVLMQATMEVALELMSQHPLRLYFALEIMQQHIEKHLPVDSVATFLPELTKFFLNLFDLRLHNAENLTQLQLSGLEDAMCGVFVTLTLKLSENRFIPFLVKLIDWSQNSKSDQKRERFVILFRLAAKLGERLKSLVCLFAGQLVQVCSTVIAECNRTVNGAYFSGENADQKENQLLENGLAFLNCCFLYDNRDFLTKDRFDSLYKPILDQIENVDLDGFDSRVVQIAETVANLAGDTSDVSWRALNNHLMLKTRDKRWRVRAAALKVAELFYMKLGEEFTQLLPESVHFIAELIEDENENVENECRKLVLAIEKIIGEPLRHYF